jgi:hypothetical protein
VSWAPRATIVVGLAVAFLPFAIFPDPLPIFGYTDQILIFAATVYVAVLLVPPLVASEYSRWLSAISADAPAMGIVRIALGIGAAPTGGFRSPLPRQGDAPYNIGFLIGAAVAGFAVTEFCLRLLGRALPDLAIAVSVLRWAIGGAAVCVGLAELILRFAGFSRPKMNQFDPVLGWRPRPGVAANYVREGAGYVSINAAGFRDVEHARTKPPGTYRIAMFGDSVTEAREVQVEETFWKRLETLLAKEPAIGGKQVEVLNFAVNGYGTAQAFLALREHALSYEPDLVLLAFVTNTDVEENSAVLNSHRFRPYFELTGGRLQLARSPGDNPKFMKQIYAESVRLRFLDGLRLYQLVREVKVTIRSHMRRPRRARRQPEIALGVSAGIYAQPPSGAWKDAWAVSEALLLEFDRLCKQSAAKFVVAVMPNPIQVTNDAAAQSRVCRELGVADLRYPDRRIEGFARAKGIHCIPLIEPFIKHIHDHGDDVYIPNPGSPVLHWTPAGHVLAARCIAAALVAMPII